MITSIRKRLHKYLQTLPRHVRNEFRDYKRRFPVWHSKSNRNVDQPYWILLPQWLHQRYCRNRKQRLLHSKFLSDILWGQYCLFLSIRIHDDLFDGHVTFPSLIFAADEFLFEAEQTFSRWMSNEIKFWEIYRSNIQSTIRAILRVDHLQQSPAASPQKLIQAYADVNAVLKIGSFAMCVHYKHPQDVVHIDRFMNNFAVGSQILDDFRDITEDLKRKRFNYVALKTLGKKDRSLAPNKVRLRDFAKQLLFSNVTNELMEEIIAYFSVAYQALEPLRIMQTRVASKRQLQYLKSMQQEMFARRAKLIFHKKVGRLKNRRLRPQ